LGYPNYEEGFFKRIWRMIRRKYYLTFKKDYVKRQLENRKGKCKMCGCCGTSPISCKYHNYITGKCDLWKKEGIEGIKKRTKHDCLNYPFDEKDKTLFSKVNCGFYWDN
jgi:hypothetical protein